jgi:hypothetical protein
VICVLSQLLQKYALIDERDRRRDGRLPTPWKGVAIRTELHLRGLKNESVGVIWTLRLGKI